MRVRHLAIVMAALLLAACSSSPLQQTQYYLLATPTGESNGGAALRSIVVELPSYLNQLGIVLIAEERQVNVASFNLWAEPLDEGIARFLRDEISGVDAADEIALRVDVHYFHGAERGEVLLDAGWTLAHDCGVAQSGRFYQTLTQSTSGYADLAATQARLLGRLAGVITTAAQALDSEIPESEDCA